VGDDADNGIDKGIDKPWIKTAIPEVSVHGNYYLSCFIISEPEPEIGTCDMNSMYLAIFQRKRYWQNLPGLEPVQRPAPYLFAPVTLGKGVIGQRQIVTRDLPARH
jgi:hypothetical protein